MNVELTSSELQILKESLIMFEEYNQCKLNLVKITGVPEAVEMFGFKIMRIQELFIKISIKKEGE